MQLQRNLQKIASRFNSMVRYRCNYHWDVEQPIKPYGQKKVYIKSVPPGNYFITVWRSPKSTKEKILYSFSFCFENSLPYRFNDFPGSPTLRGSYVSVGMAIDACVEWLLIYE